jgi:hypothetical protein
MQRPFSLYDSLFDFGPGNVNKATNYVNIDTGDFTSGSTNRSYTYRLLTDSNTPSNLFSNDNGVLGANAIYIPLNDVYQQSLQRFYTAPGKNSDTVTLYETFTTGGVIPYNSDGTINYATQIDVQRVGPGKTFSYYVFQQSVAILKELVGLVSNSVVSGSTKVATQGDTLSFDTSSARGAEQGKVITVFKKDSSNNFVTAVEGVDYNTTSGTITPTASDICHIQFLKQLEYRINFTTTGFTSSSNTYEAIDNLVDPRTLVTTNTDTTIYYITTISNVPDNAVTIPQIDVTITSDATVLNSPFTTYATVQLTITGTIDASTGDWGVTDTQTHVTTTRVMSGPTWADEIQSRCNVILEIRDADNALAVPAMTGLGPHKVRLPLGNYSAQFKTSKK